MASILNIENDNVPTFDTGGLTVGTSAVLLSGNSKKVRKSIRFTADENNSGVVYVGSRSNLTAKGGDATTGAPIYPGRDVYVGVDDLSKIYLIASAANQYVFWQAE